MSGLESPGHQSSSDYVRLVQGTNPWWRNSRLVLLNFWVAILLLTSSTNGYDASMMNGLQSLAQWQSDFSHPSGGRLGILNAIQNVGGLAAFPFAPYLTDGLGRRMSIISGAFIMLAGAIIQTAAQSVDMFIGARFLIGFGLTFCANAAPLLIIEISYPTLRGPLTSLYNTLWFLGSITAAWSTYGSFRIPSSWSWRIPSALQGLPSLLQVLLVFFVPESPRWLVSKGRRAEALDTLAYYHAYGNKEDPLVQYEYEEIKAALVVERVVSSSIGWRSLYKTKGNRKRMRIIVAIAAFSQWSGNGLLSYYLAKVLGFVGINRSQDQLLISGFLNIFNFFCAILAGLLCDKIGRRRLFLASTSSMLLFWTLLTVTLSLYSQKSDSAAAYAFVAFIYLYTSGYAIAYTPLIVSYTLEILPFALRARGFAIFSFTVSLSVIFNQYINPILLDRLGWKYYLVYVCWLAFELIFVWFYVVETKNRTLEETAALFDGDDAVAEISSRAGVHAGLDQDTSTRHSGSFKPLRFGETYELSLGSESTSPVSFSAEKRRSELRKQPPDDLHHYVEVGKLAQVHFDD